MQAVLAGFEILLYFFPGLIIGILARRWKPGLARRLDHAANLVLQATLYLILFFMGWRLVGDPDVRSQLGVLGFQAISFAFASAAGSVLAVTLVLERKHHRAAARPSTAAPDADTPGAPPRGLALRRFLANLRAPMLMLAVVVVGALGALALAEWIPLDVDAVSSVVLRAMVASVGLSMGCTSLGEGASFRDARYAWLPVLSGAGSILGAVLMAPLWGMAWNEGAALGAGFGWYSFSAVMIAEKGLVLLGALAFLTNLFRESLALVSMGFLQAAGRPLGGIAAAGATSMDVSLPLVALYRHGALSPVSVYHGFALSLAVPVLLPLLL